MSRSTKKVPCHYFLHGARPSQGKKYTSRKLRRKVRVALNIEGLDFDFCHVQDRNRGNKGTRSLDYGWRYFGDGVRVYFKGFVPKGSRYFSDDHDWIMKQKRK